MPKSTRQSASADAVYFLLKGMVKLTVAYANGKEAVLVLLVPNNIFGDDCLTDVIERRVAATTIPELAVVRIEAEAMARALRDEPRFSGFFIALLVDRKIRTELSLLDQLINSSEKRLARVLLQLTAGLDEEPHNTGIKISQAILADMAGTTRARISFFMTKFRRLGFIEYRGFAWIAPCSARYSATAERAALPLCNVASRFIE
jgi:CRP/FNR family cyclic AMP-dependent transcriptional regulator